MEVDMYRLQGGPKNGLFLTMNDFGSGSKWRTAMCYISNCSIFRGEHNKNAM